MNPVVSRFHHLPRFARLMAAGAGCATVVSLAWPALGRRPHARPPVAPPPAVVVLPQPESRPVAGPLLLTSLKIGPEPRVLVPGRQIVRTFTTDDGESCRVIATARLSAGAGPIRWIVAAPAGFVVPVDATWTGPRLDVLLRRPGGNPSGLGGPLAITVQARVRVKGKEYTARETVVEDEVDQLRQEYIDLVRRQVPDRSEFMDAAAFAARYGRRYPWLRFEDLNWSVNPATRLRYAYAIIQPELVQGLEQVRRLYGGVIINSGYRNPVHQVEVHAPVRESLHQYGYAADLAVTPGPGRGLPNEVDWRRLAEAACSARAKWVEPLASSAPNSPGCHVHLDYRPGPVSSAPVRLRGQVVEAETGKPLPDALVLLGAMPARTDANGFFGLRNVLSGGLHPVEVRADGFEALVQPVPLAAWGTASVRLAMRKESQPAVRVDIARTDWIDRRSGLLSLTLRVTNAGAAEAGDVRLGIAPAAALVSAAPASLGSLPAGASRGTRVAVRLPRGQGAAPLPLLVNLAFRHASGAEQQARVRLAAALPGTAPAGTGAATTGPAPAPAPAKSQPARPGPPMPSQSAGKEPLPLTSRPAAPVTPKLAPAAAEPEPPKPPAVSAPEPAKPQPATSNSSEPQRAQPAPAVTPAPAAAEPNTPPAPETKPPAGEPKSGAEPKSAQGSAPAGDAAPAADAKTAASGP